MESQDDRVQTILREWDRNQIWTREGYVNQGALRELATLAARALTPQCTGWHPHRPDIRCTIADHAMPEHRNEQLGLEWTDDGRTTHDELGQVALIAEQDGQNMTAPPAEDGVANTSPLESLLGVLQEASGALETVGKAYHSTSKRVTAPVYRAVRDAKESADRTITELTNAIRVVQTGG